jgi:hypothetical protein
MILKIRAHNLKTWKLMDDLGFEVISPDFWDYFRSTIKKFSGQIPDENCLFFTGLQGHIYNFIISRIAKPWPTVNARTLGTIPTPVSAI